MYEPSIVVKKAGLNDIDDLLVMIEKFYRFNEEFDPAWSVKEEARSAARELALKYIRDPSSVVLVAQIEGKTIGFIRAEIRENPILENGRLGIIVELYVHPQYRRRGVAKRLVEEASKELASRGVNVVGAEFPAANSIAKAFYENLGFRPYISVYIKEVEGT